MQTTIECEITDCRHNVNLICNATKIQVSRPYQDMNDAICETREEISDEESNMSNNK